jgi:hypothetical protein
VRGGGCGYCCDNVLGGGEPTVVGAEFGSLWRSAVG